MTGASVVPIRQLTTRYYFKLSSLGEKGMIRLL